MWMQTVTASFALCMLLAAFSHQGSLVAARERTRKEEKASTLACFCVVMCHCLCCWCCLNRHGGKRETDGMCCRERCLLGPSWCLQLKNEGSFSPRLLCPMNTWLEGSVMLPPSHPFLHQGCKQMGNMKSCSRSLAIPFPAHSPASP